MDVEDYFQVEAFSGLIRRDNWNNYPTRVDDNTRRLLDLFDESGVKATFFTLGWVADRSSAMIREIAQRGHELAVHSYWHRLIYQLTPEEFREDTIRAKSAVEQASGVEVCGYRAPSYSITRKSLWALEILAECGFRYDSSIFPVRHDVYGISDAPRRPFHVRTASGLIMEFPITTFRLGAGPNWPVAGGGYLRIFPFWYTRLGLWRARQERVPIITYLHPWEVDPAQPRIEGSALSRFRHYTNLSGMEGRVRRLCRQVAYEPFRSLLQRITADTLPEWRSARLAEDQIEDSR